MVAAPPHAQPFTMVCRKAKCCDMHGRYVFCAAPIQQRQTWSWAALWHQHRYFHHALYTVPSQSLSLLLLVFLLLQGLRPQSYDCGQGLNCSTFKWCETVCTCVCFGAETGMMRSSVCMNTGAACSPEDCLHSLWDQASVRRIQNFDYHHMFSFF